MTWRSEQPQQRERLRRLYSSQGADEYHRMMGTVEPEEVEAWLADLSPLVHLAPNAEVLDVGAGTGALCQILCRLGPLRLSALEACPAMLDQLRHRTDVGEVSLRVGFCDHDDDRDHFAPGSFDLIAGRLVTNGLYDPLAAFRNWLTWLKPGGRLIVIDGLFDRDGWRGEWQAEVDELPLSCPRSLALVPYLLEQVGFHVRTVGLAEHVNRCPTTRTPKWIVSASAP